MHSEEPPEKVAAAEAPRTTRQRTFLPVLAGVAAVVLLAACTYMAIWGRTDGAAEDRGSAEPDGESKVAMTPSVETGDPDGDDASPASEREASDQILDSPYSDELGFEVVFSAETERQGQYTWRGKVVLAPQNNGDVRSSTGVAIPNRWIVVPLQTIDDAETISVRHAGQTYEAQVRKRLEKLGFATLQIDRQEKFPAPLCDLENQLASNSKGLRLVFLNSAGKVTVSEGHDVESLSSGYKYMLEGSRVSDQAMGGIVLQGPGRITGLVAQRRYGGDVDVIPWARVGAGWGRNAGRGIFDYDTPASFGSETEANLFHASALVQVLVTKKAKTNRPSETKLRSFVFDTRIESAAPTKRRTFADWTVGDSFANSSERNIEFFESIKDGMLARAWVNPSQKRDGDDELIQFPFLMGAPVQWTYYRIADPSLDSWQTGKKVWANLKTGSSIRHNDMFQQSGESGFELKDDVRVTGRGGTWLKLERTSVMVPTRSYMEKEIKVSGSEILDVDVMSGFVRNRTFKGTYSQRGKDGEMHSAKLFLSVERLSESTTKSTPVYWRE